VFKFSYALLSFLLCLSAFVSAQETVVDPTKPLGFSAVATGETTNTQDVIQLTSILISSERKVAIINGQAVKENQILKGVGAQVKRIDADAVTLQQNGKVWRVALNSTVIRK
jgi:MSHA biogenesis protein MshK